MMVPLKHAVVNQFRRLQLIHLYPQTASNGQCDAASVNAFHVELRNQTPKARMRIKNCSDMPFNLFQHRCNCNNVSGSARGCVGVSVGQRAGVPCDKRTADNSIHEFAHKSKKKNELH
eukprot:m.1127791 g.1127791  ORF g.1127791 m.1127791 type:complete len:118 (+) comp24412_c0_seq142:2124-2477(+)